MNEQEKTLLKQKINQASVISFDIFDTLLFRKTNTPETVFDLIGKHFGIHGFRKLRMDEQNEASRRVYAKYQYPHADMDDIYEVLSEHTEIPVDWNEVKAYEIQLERDVLTANKEMLEIFQYAKAQGKRVVATSDMYLSAKLLGEFLEENGFLVRQSGDKFTTYVKFSPMTYSLEQKENVLKKKLEVAKLLAKEYVPLVREAVRNESDRLYIPSGNYELFEAALVYYALVEKCRINVSRDCSKYEIKTVDGGYFTAEVFFDAKQSDTDYKPTLELPSYYSCGSMWRIPEKYPSVSSWSIDTRYCSRQGAWQNNKTKDYEYLYEFLKGEIKDNQASEDKFKRLRERRFITEDNHVNIMMYKGVAEDLFDKLPSLSEEFKKKFADYALESAMLEAKNYPPQMQDLIVSWNTNGFVGNVVALMVMDILYGDGTFKALTEEEKVTSQLIMFSDILPE